MKTRNNMIYIIIALIIIGIVSQVTSNPSAYIIPIAVIGIVFLLYKFPPGRRKTSNGNSKRNAKKAKFKVIQGNKQDNEEEKPPYH